MEPDLGHALWAHRAQLARMRPRFEALRRAVDAPSDFPFPKWFALYALCLDVQPDLILELGRGYGNSTCVLVEAAHATGARVVSISIDPTGIWPERSAPRIRDVTGAAWFEPLDVREGDAGDVDLRDLFASAERPFLFWDAHSEELARHVLASRPGPMAVDDVGDVLSGEPDLSWYADQGLELYRIGDLYSAFEELPVIIDWLAQSERPWESAERSVARLLDREPAAHAVLAELGFPPTAVGGLLVIGSDA